MNITASTPSHAVVWEHEGRVASGGLWLVPNGFELRARTSPLAVPFEQVRRATIRRDRASRLRGLPVLALELRNGALVTIASLEGAGALHELAVALSRRGLPQLGAGA